MHFPVEEDYDGSSPFGPAKRILDFRFWILDLKSESESSRPEFLLQGEPEPMFALKSPSDFTVVVT